MTPKIEKILYATDLSENAIHAFSYAAAMANRFEAKISIVHVIEELSHSYNLQIAQMLGEEKWKAVQAQNVQKIRDTIAGRLDVFCKNMEAELKECPYIVEKVVVEQGTPVKIILRLAGTLKSDMIVMGSHGQGFMADALMGSTARRVVRRSDLPVLTIRLPKV